MAKPFAKHVLMAKHTLASIRSNGAMDSKSIKVSLTSILTNLAKIPPEEIALCRQGRSSDLKRQAAVAFAKALIETRGKASDAQFAAVKDAGWTDANIVEMIALTAQFLLTNFMNNAVQTPIDFPAASPAESA